jgi:hypothetical protein
LAEVITSGHGSISDRAVDGASARWLHGPFSDMFLGCGLLYVLLFAALGLMGPGITTSVSLGALAVGAIATGAPHYGATLLRVYEQREDRRRYALLAVWFSAGLVALFGLSLYWSALGIFLVSLYFIWNPWHYSGQNYGLAMMFLRRRGIEVTPVARRFFYASFVLSAFLAMVAMNAPRPASAQETATGAKLIAPFYHFEPLGLPVPLLTTLLVLGLIAYVSCLVIAVASLLRKGTLADILPSLLLVATQSLWFVIPVATRQWGLLQGFLPFDAQHAEYTFFFIAIGHSVQYLWVTSYFANRTKTYRGHFRYWLSCVLAGSALWNVPPLLLGGFALGTAAYTEGLAMLVAAFVNLHHFVLDGAIWKLRDGPIARILLREPQAGEAGERPPAIGTGGNRHWGRLLVNALGTLGVSVALIAWWENEFGFVWASQRGDEVRMQLAAERLEMIGRPSSDYHRHLAQVARRNGDPEGALAELDRSPAVREHPKSHFVKGHIYREQSDWGAAADAYGRAYAIDPKPVKLIYRLSQALIHAGRFDAADEVLRKGLELHPGDRALQEQVRALKRARAGVG